MFGEGNLNQEMLKFIKENSGELSSLSGNLIGVSPDKDFRSILVSSASSKEGKTVSAISMAYTLATQGDSKVVLIDGNFHTPMIHELFDINPEPGLSDILQGKIQYEKVLRKTEFKNLMLIPGGSSAADTFGFQKIGILKNTLDSLSENFDYIIVDGNSVFGSSYISQISKLFYGVVFVIEAERTRWEVVQQAKDIIINTGGKVMGCVLNKRKYYIPRMLYGNI